jgi:uncharacterized protein YbjT (DUF2867 family)
MTSTQQTTKLLVTGTTGYVGGRLVPRLLQHGYPVRVISRRISQLGGRPWKDQVEITHGDVYKPETLFQVFEDIYAAYYMIPGLGRSGSPHSMDISAAQQFGRAALRAGVKRIIYLGGLGDPCSQLSNHLHSRQQIGEALRGSGIPVTEFRAAVIVGSGSTTFELIRYLTERIPIIFLPSWGKSRIQPIAISNVIDYLVAALENQQSINEIIDIGGAGIHTLSEMMKIYAQVRGLKRIHIHLPVKIPRIASYWTHLTTPLPNHIARRLINDLCNDVLIENDRAATLFPDIHPVGYEQAVASALRKLDAGDVETSWSDSVYSGSTLAPSGTFHNEEGMVYEQRQAVITALPSDVFNVVTHVGGEHGWFFMNWAWRLRGFIDRIGGGVGLQRGRRNPDELRVGDAVDFWRVEAIEPNKLIRLRAEMKVPGRAWLQFEISPHSNHKINVRQTAIFAPKGLSGTLYWYALYPIHKMLFSGMIRKIAEKSEAQTRLQEKSAT